MVVEQLDMLKSKPVTTPGVKEEVKAGTTEKRQVNFADANDPRVQCRRGGGPEERRDHELAWLDDQQAWDVTVGFRGRHEHAIAPSKMYG